MAINKDFQDQVNAGFAQSCRKPPCPAVDCALHEAMSAACVKGRCVARKGPGF
jgi:hypothetical protein